MARSRRRDWDDDAPETREESTKRIFAGGVHYPGDKIPAKVEIVYHEGRPVHIDITYTTGETGSLAGKQIDSDHPIMKQLANIRTVIRLWRLSAVASGKKAAYWTDEEIMKKASGEKLDGSIEDVAKTMGYVSEYFITGEDGKPIVKNGDWVVATPADYGAHA